MLIKRMNGSVYLSVVPFVVLGVLCAPSTPAFFETKKHKGHTKNTMKNTMNNTLLCQPSSEISEGETVFSAPLNKRPFSLAMAMAIFYF